MNLPQIIVVDDEPELSELIGEYLGRNGFQVRTAASGTDLDTCLAAQGADLIVLDVNMPGEDGLSISRRLRRTNGVPILMLTSAGDVVDRVLALEVGVDDYVTKPFDLRELRARIRTILRRTHQPVTKLDLTAMQVKPARRLVPFGIVQMDTEARCLYRGDGTEVALTAMEYDLLQVFADNPNRVLTRDRLLELANRNDRDPFDRSIDIRVTRLRRKVESDPAKPTTIRTVRGTGYMFVPAKPRHEAA